MKKTIFALVTSFSLLVTVSAFSNFNLTKTHISSDEITYLGEPLLISKPLLSVYDASGNRSNYMPLRDVIETLGYKVDYDNKTKTILLSDNVPIPKEGNYIDNYGVEVPNGYISLTTFINKNLFKLMSLNSVNNSDFLSLFTTHTKVLDGRFYILESEANSIIRN